MGVDDRGTWHDVEGTMPPPHFAFPCGCRVWIVSCHEGDLRPDLVLPDLSLLADTDSTIDCSLDLCSGHSVFHSGETDVLPDEVAYSPCDCFGCGIVRGQIEHNWKGLRSAIAAYELDAPSTGV